MLNLIKVMVAAMLLFIPSGGSAQQSWEVLLQCKNQNLNEPPIFSSGTAHLRISNTKMYTWDRGFAQWIDCYGGGKWRCEVSRSDRYIVVKAFHDNIWQHNTSVDRTDGTLVFQRSTEARLGVCEKAADPSLAVGAPKF